MDQKHGRCQNKMEARLDGTYTRLLMRVQNVSWKSHPTKGQIYGDLPPISPILKARRIQFAGHCYRAENDIISSLLLEKGQFVYFSCFNF